MSNGQEFNPFAPGGAYSGGMSIAHAQSRARLGGHEYARRQLHNLYVKMRDIQRQIDELEKHYPDLAQKAKTVEVKAEPEKPAPKRKKRTAKKEA